MAWTYSQTILEGKSPQYVYALVILSGGVAFVVSQSSDLIAAALLYVLMAALFAFIWPDRPWQWAVWLCLPILVLLCFDLLVTGSFAALMRNGLMFVRAFPSASIGAYVGARFSARKVANRFATAGASRRRLSGNGRGAQSLPAFPDRAASMIRVKSVPANGNHRAMARAIERSAPVLDLNAALFQAAQEGELERIELLVAQGADVNAKSSDKWPPLMLAALDGDVETVKALFGSGAASEVAGAKGWTALMLATIEGRAEVVRVLLEHGAEVDAKNHDGWTALRFAVSMDETEILRTLLSAGADVNLSDKEGRTALMQAAGENLRESLELLLAAGADPFLRDCNEQTALMIARLHGHAESIRLLKEAQAKVEGTFSHATLLADEFSYFHQLKEELEDGLRAHLQSPSQSPDDTLARLLSAIQNLQEYIDATRKERLLAPSEIAHKLVLTLKEAATLSGLPRQHLLEAIEAGRLKAQRFKQGRRITRTDLDNYVRRLK